MRPEKREQWRRVRPINPSEDIDVLEENLEEV